VTAPQAIYARRFAENQAYRARVWHVLARRIFQPFVPDNGAILDLGCGYGELINNIRAGKRYAIDLNPDARAKLAAGIEFLEQSSADPWPLPAESLDAVLTSNFFEHLPSKQALQETLAHAARALRPGGVLVALGPNIRFLAGAYWDFVDHHVPLSDRSLAEALELAGLSVRRIVPRFLPYTMADAPGKSPRRAPAFLVELYLRLPLAWPLFGKQFLIVAEKRASA